MLGLELFIDGAREELEHHQNFDVDDVRAGNLAHGMVRYARG